MKKSLMFIGFLTILMASNVHSQDIWKPGEIQTGFYTPQRVGQLWDTWLYFYKGQYYQYYLAGKGGKWDSFELMTSKDGVNWQQFGRILEPRKGTTWMGTGHIIEAPGFENHSKWIMNYSEWFGEKQDIMFATSDDLVHWNKVSESLRFVQDPRWYHPKGRWDCIDCIKREDGSYYGYFTADPIQEKFNHEVCGFGFAKSTDGIQWIALPPVEGNITGELGGIQKIGDKYYITVSEGRIAVSDKPEGPFLTQKKNPNMFGKGCDIYFPRFFHNPPSDKTLNGNGVLVNHFYTGSETIFSSPLKAVEIDQEGILRLKWWQQNELLKERKFNLLSEHKSGSTGLIHFFKQTFDTDKVGVIESEINLVNDDHEKSPAGFYFEANSDSGYVILFNKRETVFGTLNSDGTNLKISVRISRDINFTDKSSVRLVFKRDMMEAYLNDYLVMLKRMKWTGKSGVVERIKNLNHIKAWVHN
jgi:predicted GH43/DUF377 family glycosyl hydrolase